MREWIASGPASLTNPMYSKKYHDFSLVISRQKSYCVTPPQQMECLVDLCDWFIPEYPQFLR